MRDTDSGSPRDVDRATSMDELRLGLDRLQRMLGSRRIQARLVEVAGVELTQQSVQVLGALTDGVQRPVADVARQARMDVGAVSRQLRTLEQHGFVTRRASPDHGSVVLVEATDAGRAAASRIDEVRRRHFTEALASWPAEDFVTLGRLMIKLVEDLQRTPYRDEP
jgi:DNA-binding MarR family transcriptional regulator